MRMTSQFTITFGALAPPIGEQIKAQGIVVTNDEAERFERIAKGITMLHLQDITPDSVRDNARKKLMKKISVCVKKDDVANGIPNGYSESDFADMDNPNGHPDRINTREDNKVKS